MEGSRRRSFTEDYKRQAVDLVASSGRSIGSVAKELGLRDSVLRRWMEQRGARLEPTAAARRPPTQATLLKNYSAIARQSGWEARDNQDGESVSRRGDDCRDDCRAQEFC